MKQMVEYLAVIGLALLAIHIQGKITPLVVVTDWWVPPSPSLECRPGPALASAGHNEDNEPRSFSMVRR